MGRTDRSLSPVDHATTTPFAVVTPFAPGDPVDLFLGGAAEGEGLATDQRGDAEKTRNELRRHGMLRRTSWPRSTCGYSEVPP